MKLQVRKISTHQSAKIIAILTAVSALFIMPVALLPVILSSGGLSRIDSATLTTLIFMPIIYLMLGYVFMRLYFWIYNKLSAKFGGIEFELDEVNKVK